MNTIQNKDLKKRIIDISHKHELSHLGSCLTAVDIIDEIYKTKKNNEKFILSSGHAGLALYVVIEKYEELNAEDIYNHHGVHPDLCSSCHLDCSTGSLGQGLPIAVGMALADRSKNVYCLISDGECSEGSIWEALNVVEKYNIQNLKIYVNVNGYGAYDEIEDHVLYLKLKRFHKNIKVYQTTNELPFLNGLSAHYHVMSDEDYNLAINKLNEHNTFN